MKSTKNLTMLFLIVFAILVGIPVFSNAATPVTDEESLLSAIASADSGATISVQNNITVTQPIVIAKELTIDGNGYTIVGSTEWTSTSGNQTMFTAQLGDAKLTLKDIDLNNGPKYGVQSYDGATVILDNVSITGFRYGGVLVNGGKLQIKDLHLGTNGTGANNGIEIDKGAAATNNPSVVMDGVLTSDVTENVIRVASNGHLTDFAITNTENTTNKIVLAENSVVLTDENNNVIAESPIPENATPNVDTKTVVVTLIAGEQTNKIVVEAGKAITEEILKAHVTVPENYQLDGFFTDADYTNAFDFSTVLDSNTTIYAKISEVPAPEPEPDPEPEPEPPVQEPEKDDVPKTGAQNYLEVAILAVVVSSMGMYYTFKKNRRG